MKAYIVQSKKKTNPFEELPGNCLIGNKKIVTIQKEVLQSLGIEQVLISDISQINDEDEHIILNDSIYLTSELLKEFIPSSQRRRSNTVCALKPGITTLRTVVTTQEVKIYPEHIEYDLFYVPKKELRSKSQPIIIDSDQVSEGIPMPRHMCGSDKYLIPVTDKFIAQIDHWTNLWSVNIVSVLSNIARLQKMPKAKLFALALKARSINKWKILKQFNTIGTGCDIHPAAYIEGSTIGDNVTVGGHSIIRESIIGNNAFIGNGAKVETSVIGEKSSILHGHIMFSVLYPGVFSVAQMISASLIGRDSFIGSGVTLTDFRLDGENVTVVKDGISIDTGNTFIGSCLGHETYLGSGCVVAPGRVIPNKVRIAPEKKSVITGIDSHESKGYRLIKKTE